MIKYKTNPNHNLILLKNTKVKSKISANLILKQFTVINILNLKIHSNTPSSK